MVDDSDEVRRLLRISYDERGESSTNATELIRFWALDMQWFSPEAAESVLTSLLKGGWILQDKGELKPALDVSKIEIPLGWRPIARRLLRIQRVANDSVQAVVEGSEKMVQRSVDELVSKAHNESKVKSNKEFEDEPTVGSEIVQKTASEVASKKSVDTDIASDSEPKVAQSVPQDPWVDRIPDLLNSITKSSGLERKEVMRRAQRKRLALGPVTLWMTLLLVAREQRIELTDLMA